MYASWLFKFKSHFLIKTELYIKDMFCSLGQNSPCQGHQSESLKAWVPALALGYWRANLFSPSSRSSTQLDQNQVNHCPLSPLALKVWSQTSSINTT